jgi:hypothetical protein
MKQVKQAANQPDVEACWGEAGNFSVVLVFVWPKIAAKVFRRRSGATAATAGYGFARSGRLRPAACRGDTVTSRQIAVRSGHESKR